jgi:hypothetical protein
MNPLLYFYVSFTGLISALLETSPQNLQAHSSIISAGIFYFFGKWNETATFRERKEIYPIKNRRKNPAVP